MRPLAVALPCPHRTLSLCPSTAAQGARRSPTRCTLARRAIPMRCIQPGRRGVARADGPRRTGGNGPAASAGARRVTSLGASSGSRAARVDIGTQAAATLHSLHGRRRSAQGQPLGCARPWWTARRHPSALARSCRALRGAARGRPRYAPELRPLHSAFSGSAVSLSAHAPARLPTAHQTLMWVYEGKTRCAQMKN